ELALTLVLLAGAGLMVRTTVNLLQADSLVDISHLLLANVQMPTDRYSGPARRTEFAETVTKRLDAQPGIRFATVANAMPFYTAPLRVLSIEGRPDLTAGPPIAVSYVTIGRQYFETLGIHLLLGRDLSPADGTTGHLAAIVNQRFVQMFFGAQNPLGGHIRASDPEVGVRHAPCLPMFRVAPTVRQHYGRELDPVIYVPYQHDSTPVPVVLIRAGGDPNGAVPLLRNTLNALDPHAVLFGVTTLEQLLETTGF